MNPLIMKYFAKRDPQIAERYGHLVDDNKEIEDAQNAQKRQNALGMIGQGLENMVTAGGRARGFNSNSSGFWNDFGNAKDRDVTNARQKKQDAIDGLLTGDKLEWQGVERERQGQDWANADQDRERKKTLEAREDADYARTQAIQKAEDDPNSPQSVMYRKFAKKIRPDLSFDGMSATEIKGMQAPIKKMYEIDENNKSLVQAAKEKNLRMAESRDQRNYERDLKREEKMEGMRVGDLGYANTVEDAKDLKQAMELKKDFDSKLDEMIALREKHNGGALLNREDVARGKQLSKDLLLAYKNMAKLGVLSKSDEDIINAIVPEDPLEYNSPLAAMQGQDPTLNRLKKFREDGQKNWATKMEMRLRKGSPGLQKTTPKFPLQVRDKNGRVATVSSAEELAEAQAEGFSP